MLALMLSSLLDRSYRPYAFRISTAPAGERWVMVDQSIDGNGQALVDPSVFTNKDYLRQLFVWDVAQKQHIVRCAQAAGYGLDPTIYSRPFPGTNVSTQNHYHLSPPEQPKAPVSAPVVVRNGLSKAAAAGLIGLSLLGGAGGALGVASLLKKPDSPGNTVQTQGIGYSIELVPQSQK